MTLTTTIARTFITTNLTDNALGALVNAVNADITRLGGWGYPLRFADKLVDAYVISESGASSATTRSFLRGGPAIGKVQISDYNLFVTEVSYTLASLSGGDVTITLTVDSPGSTQTVYSLPFQGYSFYLCTDNGRIEAEFDTHQRLWSGGTSTWNLGDDSSARELLKGVATGERVRFVVATPYAALRMPVEEWNARLDQIALDCLRVLVNDKAIMDISEKGGEVEEAVTYLGFIKEYQDRLFQTKVLTGNVI